MKMREWEYDKHNHRIERSCNSQWRFKYAPPTYPDIEVGAAPDTEVEEKVSVDFTSLLLDVAELLH